MKRFCLLVAALLLCVASHGQTVKLSIDGPDLVFHENGKFPVKHPAAQAYGLELPNGNVLVRTVADENAFGLSFDGKQVGLPYSNYTDENGLTFASTEALMQWLAANTSGDEGGRNNAVDLTPKFKYISDKLYELTPLTKDSMLIFVSGSEPITLDPPINELNNSFEWTIAQDSTEKVGTSFYIHRGSTDSMYVRTRYTGDYMTIMYDARKDKYRVIGGEAYTYKKMGPELVPEPNFENDGANWAVSNADATHTVTFSSGLLTYVSPASPPYLQFESSSIMSIGKTYTLQITIAANRGAGNIQCQTFEGDAIIIPNTPGTYTYEGLVSDKVDLEFVVKGTNVDLDISYISLKEEL
ncbi:hypothetical protein Q4603_05630 [Zobellia galactanivorans]|uniref:hypothetical protein n=1 Tax=Zobellia galactanivorans (strain DSM 12802 / CCUG 47099 / CIP 106680 / NCIMB 13871 / Dsij) TaxID=63186 RepID=UPI0026E424C8|nr:hypothetical protein [Zobellia galactanivorans]MDO6808075.1 hypothetical protein [Zobellia galactanivorans]